MKKTWAAGHMIRIYGARDQELCNTISMIRLVCLFLRLHDINRLTIKSRKCDVYCNIILSQQQQQQLNIANGHSPLFHWIVTAHQTTHVPFLTIFPFFFNFCFVNCTKSFALIVSKSSGNWIELKWYLAHWFFGLPNNRNFKSDAIVTDTSTKKNPLNCLMKSGI